MNTRKRYLTAVCMQHVSAMCQLARACVTKKCELIFIIHQLARAFLTKKCELIFILQRLAKTDLASLCTGLLGQCVMAFLHHSKKTAG